MENIGIQEYLKKKTAEQQGSILLSNVKVKKYIEGRIEEIKSSKIMDQVEVMERLTAIARGKLKTGVVTPRKLIIYV